jgi:3-oxoacyl-[acyl-carrier-protein] synthase II
MRRVVITGLGSISPHGVGTAAFWNGLLEAKSSITPLTRFNPDAFGSRIAGTIPAFKTTDHVPKSYRKATKIMARDIEIAVIAADLAVRDAKLLTKSVASSATPEQLAADGWFKPNPTRVGCNIGAGLICADLDELAAAMSQARGPEGTLSLAKWGKSDDPSRTSGMENLTPLWLLKYLPNMLACHVSILHDTQGPSNTITCGHASAGLALAEATRTIQREQADIALVGGCESKINPMALMRWSLLHRLNTESNATPETSCRPYDAAANGAILAEGGAVLIIEEYEHAKARNATIYAEIAGLGATANATQNVIEPDPTGEAPAVAIRKALKDAGLTPADIGLIISSGFSVPNWDKADAAALQQAFGADLARTTVTPVRGGIGDPGAGSQALDLVAATLALKEQVIPPAVNVTDPIANLPINTRKLTPEKPLAHALILATALGGQNSAIILKRAS